MDAPVSTIQQRAALYLRVSTARQAEQRGAKVKKKLEIDPLHADTVRRIFSLTSQGDGTNGPMGVKAIATLKATRDQARVDAERATASLESSGRKSITPDMLAGYANTARQRIRIEGGGYRRDHLRALTQRVEVAENEVRIIGSKSRLFEVLAGKPGPGTKLGPVPSFVPKWCARQDSNLWPPD